MKTLQGRTAVLTGAASGFGLELARRCAGLGMKIVMADVQQDALDRAAAEVAALGKASGAEVLAFRLDVSKAEEVEALGAAVLARFGAPHLVFNNAGIGIGGLIWEHSRADWDWTIGVNLMGVAHGVRVFVPMMLAAAEADPDWEGHVVNTASMAGLVNMPNMGAYNVSKHAVVSLSETLFQDLRLVTTQVAASVLCPYFVPTGIHQSERVRPDALPAAAPTRSQLVGQAMAAKAVTAGKVSAADVAGKVIDAVLAGQFYIYSHPQAVGIVATRAEDIVQGRNPSDPFAERPEVGERLRQALMG